MRSSVVVHRTLRNCAVGVITVAALTAALLVAPPPEKAAAAGGAPPVPAAKPVGGRAFTAKSGTPVSRVTRPDATPRKQAPKAGTYRLDASTPAAQPTSTSSPIEVATARKLGSPVPTLVTVADVTKTRAAGLNGILLTVARPAAKANSSAPTDLSVALPYDKFRDLYGADWATRLQFHEVTGCDAAHVSAKCRPRASTSRNDVKAARLSASVRLAPGEQTTLVALAGVSGSSGAYDATSLSPSSSWDVSLQTGDFSWSYPLRVPPAPGGPAPTLGLDYSSGSVDGRTASTNNQPSWIGEGFSFEPGFIERKYVTCADDMTGSNTSTKTYDQCWKSHNATLSMAGHSSELVRNGSGWALKNADGSKIEQLTGGLTTDGEDEYWRLTTPDGTKYYFGIGKRYTADTIDTASTFTAPVFGNQPGEPCYAASYASAYCTQGWRWSLDYVVDPDGNTMTYQYVRESNNYGRNNNTAVSSYTRNGYLSTIEYGERVGTEATTTAPLKVTFGVSERCLPSGSITCADAQLTAANASYWPDVPYDQICTSATTCSGRVAPSFFTRKRLTSITTSYLSGSTPVNVDQWTLTHTFPATGDSTSKALWLKSITHTGVNGTPSVAMPAITFQETMMANRVDGIDFGPPMYKARMASIDTDSGSRISVVYQAPECVAGTNVPASPSTNTKLCMPVYWALPGDANPTLNYFHKYVVSSTVVDDLTADSGDMATFYTYTGTPAWHYDDNELGLPKYRTYGDYRGFSNVELRSGLPGSQTREQYTYMRGMHGDRLPGSGTRTASVTDSENFALTDSERLNGFVREHIVYDGTAGPEVNGTINDPWISGVLASDGTDESRHLRTAKTRSRVALDAGGYRRTTTSTLFDTTYGLPYEVDDAGDDTTTADDQCTRISYIRNTTAPTWIISTESRRETVAVKCATTPTRPDQVINDTRTLYDTAAYGVAPIRGNVTQLEAMSGYTSGTPTYALRARLAVDAHGRTIETYDGSNKRTSRLDFTPTTGGPVTQIKNTDALNYLNTTTVSPGNGATLAEVDANTRRTDFTYDALGQLTAVWAPDRNKAGGATPTARFTYTISKTAPSVVTTETLTPSGAYRKSFSIYDGMLRPRQSQTVSAINSGRLITDTIYDSRGNAAKIIGPSFDTGTANGTLFAVNEPNSPAVTETLFDGANRPTTSIFRSINVEKWRTTTAYAGDRTTVTPPAGGIPTATLSDARGQTTEVWRYKATTPTGTPEKTLYGYSPSGNLSTVADTAGNTWTYGYDYLGRQTSSNDPDKGASATTYDTANRVATTTDARGKTLAYTYDALDRRTETRLDTSTGTLLTKWTYDTLAKGKLTKHERITTNGSYSTAVTAYDALYRPTASSVSLPASEGTLQGPWTQSIAYNVDGSVKTLTIPAMPGIPAETLQYYYDALGQPTSLGGIGTLASTSARSPYGEALQYTLGDTPTQLTYQTLTVEDGTRRLTGMAVKRNAQALPDIDTTYAYDPIGNVTSIKDTAVGQSDTQCFSYHPLRQVKDAWTPADGNCDTTPTVAGLGGAAPYWNSYDYDSVGNRTVRTAHSGSGDVTTTLQYPTAGQPRPHQVTSVTVGANPAVPVTSDPAGNTTDRPRGAGSTATQSLTWDDEGQLASLTDSVAGTTSFVYDANGDRLLKREPGATTLYLDNQEVRLDTTTALRSTTRYYNFDGATVAVRDKNGLRSLITDHLGTGTAQIKTNTGDLNRRRFDLFGNPRGTAPGTWIGEAGYVGGQQDTSTGLTHLGARDYDPDLGRFTSVDPVIDHYDPSTLNPYTYGKDNPATFSDPSGLYIPWEGNPAAEPPNWRGSTVSNNIPPPDLSGYTSNGNGNGNKSKGESSSISEQAAAKVAAAQAKKKAAVEMLKRSAMQLAKIVADELGITDAFNCFTKGDLGGCISTGATILTSIVGGFVGKMLLKYGAPWKWARAAALAERVWKVADDALGAIKGFFKASDDLVKAGRSISFGPAPEDAWTVLNRVDAKNSPLPGYKGGKAWENDGREGSQILPRGGGDGAINYHEWDLSPKVKGVGRDDRRLVTGSDGTAYYTPDHYKNFVQFR